MLTISQTDPRPMYQQIVEQICHRVAVGGWSAGQELPSIRALAVELKVSVITVKRAYFELEHAGVIVTRQGRGTFVAENAELGASLTGEEIDQHLHAAVDRARLLGWDAEALQARLREIWSRTREESK
jgi:GntR family transcriptional regulator